MKPILFNTEMVQAIIDGRKTVTRRVMKPQPLFYTGRKYIFADETCPKKFEDCDNIFNVYQYQVGDILYVRETWAMQECEKCRAGMPELGGICQCGYVYRANYGTTADDSFPPSMFRWKPSIHMPKEAARIFLRIKDVRVERLQDISDEEAKKEGSNVGCGIEEKIKNSAIDRFKSIWNSTVKKKDYDNYGWHANPWVWVIEFERVEVENE